MRYRFSPASLAYCSIVLCWLVTSTQAQTSKPAVPVPAAVKEKAAKVKELADRLRSPIEAERPLVDKLRSPRETLKTLYFAALFYDLFPKAIEDAIACLDLETVAPRPARDDAALWALQLEQLLQSLSIPLHSVPDHWGGSAYTLCDANDIRIALRRGDDGAWRFDWQTLDHLPVMRRTTRERAKARDVAGLREGFTDPRATMHQFVGDAANGDFYAAARALDLSTLSDEQRRELGPGLAQQLAFIQQRRGFFFRQEVPDHPDGPAYTWHADDNGRITLDRVRGADGKDAWLFTRHTVRNIPKMYAAARQAAPDARYLRLGLLIPPLDATNATALRKRPDDIPAHLGSPRALLRGFFRVMDAADTNDARLADSLEYLDLGDVPVADRAAVGGKLASKLEAVLRKLPLELSAISDAWNAPPLILGEAQGVRVEIMRQRDGCWRVSRATVARLPDMFDKLAGKTRAESGTGAQLDSARDTVNSFQAAAGHRDFVVAAHCLNLSEIHASARDDLGPILAFKLKYVLDRIGRIYVQEIPDNPEGPRYVLYRGVLGRIDLERRADEPAKGHWQFTPQTVQHIEAMYRTLLAQKGAASEDAVEGAIGPSVWDTPGPWLRNIVPARYEVRLAGLDVYHWVGLGLACFLSWAAARLAMRAFTRVVAWLLHRSGSEISTAFVASALRPTIWLTTVGIFFTLLGWLDLPIAVATNVFAAQKFVLAALCGWLGMRLIDLSMAIYTNSELLKPHRNLSDMIVPVSMRFGKTFVLLVIATYMIYQVGEIDLLGRFLTGLGVAGLAASLAAQDALKSFFGTLLLIGERVFKIGDKIVVGGKEGVVEQVGFRSTRLRTGEDSLLTIPNAVIASSPIDNLGARSSRRFTMTIEVSPETPAGRLLEFRDRLKGWLAEQEHVVREKADCHIHQITRRGVELSLSLFLDSMAGADETRFREGLNCEILRLADELTIVIAPLFPRLPQEEDADERPAQAA